MCGILGYVGEGCDDAVFERALNTMSHRGPDGFGISKHRNVALGHRRLSIIDLSDNGKQPMELLDRYVITFNGEIYNYKEIKEQLSAAGIEFKSDSDTEVLLHAYIKWGPSCLHKFNGMWSFAIWDKENQTLFIARDRIGKKPFFYSSKLGAFIFSSEMKGIYPFLNKIEINQDLAQFAIKHPFDYESTENCLIQDIKRFPAGSYGVYSFKDGLKITKYWDVLDERKTNIPKSYEEQVELFRELFLDSCKIRMRSDVTIGTALSGGLDSSTVMCSMDYLSKNGYKGIQKNFQHAFIASFPGTSIDETEYAKAVTDSLNVKANFVEINPLLELDDIYRQTYLFEEIYYAPTIPFVQLYRNLRQNNVTVSIDGHGADELFAGYPFDIIHAIPDSLPNINQ
jgi:asparagine synthase (glutamine-hydrolysing)